MQEKQTKISEELSFEEKLKKFFENIAILELKPEDKQEIAINTKEYSKWDKLYWFEIFLSSSIATLGLIQNSVAVII
jgi:ethanolamine utilization cobalamin adenosyltransferase